MDTQPAVPTRVVVVARPSLARHVETILRNAGLEVYRTPDVSGVESLVARVRPRLVIIAQDIPWADPTETPYRLANQFSRVPVLLICEVGDDGPENSLPRLSTPIDRRCLLLMVAQLLERVDY
jgi:hypothetical protein